MILLSLLAVGILIFAIVYLWESGLFNKTKKFDATVVDETEDEVYDNTGGTKIRFYKVYEYFDDRGNAVVRSNRPMKKIDDDTGRKCIIYVEEKNRKAMEKRDVVRYRIYSAALILASFLIFGVVVYVRCNILGA